MKTAMMELIELLELNTTNEPLPHLIDVIKEIYIQKEKEQIIKHIDRYCDFYGHTNVGEQLYNAWYVKPVLKPINK